MLLYVKLSDTQDNSAINIPVKTILFRRLNSSGNKIQNLITVARTLFWVLRGNYEIGGYVPDWKHQPGYIPDWKHQPAKSTQGSILTTVAAQQRTWPSTSMETVKWSFRIRQEIYWLSGEQSASQKMTPTLWIQCLFLVRSQNCEKRMLASSCLSFCPCAWNPSAPTGRIFMKFDIWVFFESLSRNLKLHIIWQ